MFDTTVPSQRPVVCGTRHYTIDVREFILSQNNSVIRATLNEKIRPFAATLRRDGDSLFESHVRGSFDFRANAILRWVGANIRYVPKEGHNPWQFPDETLTVAGGACEDLAFLIASLLLGSGVSGYHVRVAIGEVHSAPRTRHDHAWVMYKNESGQWRLFEPLCRVAKDRTKRPRTETGGRKPVTFIPAHANYVPSFLFNDEHLWIVFRHGNPSSIDKIARRSWNRMSPKFAGDVHLSILDRALIDVPREFRDTLHARFQRLALVSPLIDPEDWIDVLHPSATPYDPRQHFDNGLISEGWDLLEDNAARFRKDRTDAVAFAKAAHAISDLYAHSSYMAFAWASGGATPTAPLFHPDTWRDSGVVHDLPDYGPNSEPELGRFDLHRFSTNRELWKGSTDAAVAAWNGKLVSGRYGQGPDDRKGSMTSRLAEGMCALPQKYRRPELGALPHHSEIAVDEADWTASHRLFEGEAYAMQFRSRVNTAVAHVRKLWETGVP